MDILESTSESSVIQFQSWARLKCDSRYSPIPIASRRTLLRGIEYRGLCVKAAMASAVLDFPLPELPWRRIVRPAFRLVTFPSAVVLETHTLCSSVNGFYRICFSRRYYSSGYSSAVLSGNQTFQKIGIPLRDY